MSFTSLLVGMMTGSDRVSLWLKDELERQKAPAQKIAGRRSRSFEEASLASAGTTSLSGSLAASRSASQAIQKGRAIADDLEDTGALDLRHVAAAYPILPDWHLDDFRDLGIDRLAWCRAYGRYMAESFPKEKWYWRSYADRASPVPLTSFSADVYTERDMLGIDRSVEALALLMASTRTDTPLSIGVFGPWGSGKSFFMRHLRKRIWGLSEREQSRVAVWKDKREKKEATLEDAPLYYGQVAQVEFNAWHYNEGNLVASLVDHLFRNLRVLPGTKDKELNERRTEVLLKISGAKEDLQVSVQSIDQAETDVNTARADVHRVEQEVASVRKEIEIKSSELQHWASEAASAREQLDGAIQDLAPESNAIDARAFIAVALRPLTDSPVLEDVRRAGKALTAGVTDWRKFLSRLFSPVGAAVVVLLLVASAVVKLADNISHWWTALTAFVTAALAILAPAIKFIRERREQFEAKLKELEKEQATQLQKREEELGAAQAGIQAAWDAKLGALRSTLEQQRTALAAREAAADRAVRTLADRTKDLDAKVHERASAEVKLRELETQLKRLTSSLLLDEFIKDRSATDEYRKQLGFLALVRRDFERLSDLIAASNEAWCSPDKDDPPPLLNRIVLYIDDLDRCTVTTVISVLEAVHLLLAFPLFVCVVAVDPRWIEECLREKHDHLFGGKEKDEKEKGEKKIDEKVHVTVGDYLEKIFQIPIWMSPIGERQRASLVKSLLGVTAAPPPKGSAPPPPEAEEPPPPPRTRVPAGGANDGFQAAVDKASETPDPLDITRDEAMFVDRVGPLLSDKPRALKRFVNTYRLLKASLPDIERKGFVDPDDPSSAYKICIGQLAFFTGQPREAPLLVRELLRAEDKAIPLKDWFDSLPKAARAPIEKATVLIPACGQIRLDAFRAWLPDTTKYLFHRDD